MQFLESILTSIQNNSDSLPQGLPALEELVHKCQHLIKGTWKDLLNELLDLSLYILINRILEKDATKSFTEENFPKFFAYKRWVDELIGEIKRIPQTPQVLHDLLLPGSTENEWVEIYDKALADLSKKQLNALYNRFKRPITVFQRAKWYQVASPALFLSLPIVDLICYSMFAARRKKTPKPSLPTGGTESFSQAVGKIVGRLVETTSIETFKESLDQANPSPLHRELKRYIADHEIDRSELTEILLENIVPVAYIDEIGKITAADANTEILNTPVSEVFEGPPQKAFKPALFSSYFAVISLDEREDILCDYIWRFNAFLEQDYKLFLEGLQDGQDRPKKGFQTLGPIHDSLHVSQNKLIQDLTTIRNAVAHASFSIRINPADILRSKIEFTDSKKIVRKSWQDFITFAEGIYQIMLGFDRRVEEKLVASGFVQKEFHLLDAPSKVFARFLEMFLDLKEEG